uniref:Sulfatase N-terminal domain-containing protein n=1 Tax=Clastoptera arizonana TaxID=38151 RepID=A0A1B6E1L1_9HEMI
MSNSCPSHKTFCIKRVSGIDAHRNTEDAWQELVGKYATDVFTEEAVNIINNHHGEKPLYLQVSHLAVHAGNGGTTLEVRDKEDTLTKFDYIKDYNRRLYSGMIQALDDSVGSIVTALKIKNLLENSIILFMSDNGAPTVDPLWNTNNFGSNWPLRGLKSSLHEGGVRVPSIIYSPLIGHSNTFSYLFHVTDWLPTLYEAAGGNTLDLGKIDGISQWETLRSGISVTPQRTTILLDIDEILKQEALIKGAWKIIKYDTKSRNNFSNAYYGSSGRDKNSPEYNITAVITSPVQLALINGVSSNSERFLYKRKQANFDSNCKKIVEKEINEGIIPCSDYCLFNLNNDPCENTDMSNNEPNILNELISLMDDFKSVKVPANNFTIDERSHPKYFNNKWVPWLDELNSTCTGYKKNKSNWTVNGSNNIIFAVIFSIFLQRIFGNRYF